MRWSFWSSALLLSLLGAPLLVTPLLGTPLLGTSEAPASAVSPLRVVAYSVEPFAYLSDGRPAGLEVEILEHYASSVDRQLAIQWVATFSEVLEVLARGDADVAAATITITEARREQFDFSASYFPVRVHLVVRKGRQVEELGELSGATLATVRGTLYEELLGAVPQAELLYAEGEREQFDLVADGRAEALASDSPVVLQLLPSYPQLELGIPLTGELGFGFAVAKGSPLAPELSRHIRQLKESKSYFRLLEKHFGEEAAAMVTSGRVR